MQIGFGAAFARGISLLTGALVACACGASASPSKPLPDNALRAPMPRFLGRVDRRAEGETFAWSGSGVEARFAGSGLALHLRVGPGPAARAEEPVLYSVRVDEGSPQLLEIRPGKERYVLAEHLDPDKTHDVVVMRETEALAGVHGFLGFDLHPGTELVALPKERFERREIEVIGDSITCGYGVLGESAECKFSYATERFSETYAAVAARDLGVDAATLCWSGRGVYRNYDEPDEPTVPRLWTPRPKPPAAVVVHLGTNDVLAPRAPFVPALFEDAYVAFLTRIREAYAKPWILVAVSPMLQGPNREAMTKSLERVVARRRSDGEARLATVVFEEQGRRVGCDFHPDREVHRRMGKQLVDALHGKLE